jgi:hypothetical protein
MKLSRTLSLMLFFIFAAPAVHAFDLSGIEIHEIPIPVDQDQAELNASLRTMELPMPSVGEWVSMTDLEREAAIAKVQSIKALQEALISNDAKLEREQDDIAKPDVLCKQKFGPQFKYAGGVSTIDKDQFEHRSYLCASFGPSKKTSFEKRIAQLNGYLLLLEFKIRHPLTGYPG